MKKIILCPNTERDPGLTVTARVGGILDGLGVPYEICEGTERLGERLENAEMIITFGGDGTILHAARAASRSGVPILGVNMGTKGFMAELEVDEIDMVKRVVLGEYRLEKRMMMDVSIMRSGKTVFTDFALNDAVVGCIAKIVDITVSGDGKRIMSFAGDGLVVATPTGSTAYSMAAGGPIVEPDAENIIVTPICPHVLRERPYVLTASRLVSVNIGTLKNKQVYMSVDGGESVPLQSEDIICIKRSETAARLVRVTNKSFYEKVSDKLGDKR